VRYWRVDIDAGGLMSARITVNLTPDGEFQIWLNEEGRDLLVQKLQRLSERNDHVHLGSDESAEVIVSSVPYEADHKILEYGKVLFRTDAWDGQYYPHVLSDPA
jgi:hypothetical protein